MDVVCGGVEVVVGGGVTIKFWSAAQPLPIRMMSPKLPMMPKIFLCIVYFF
jgi:hypothetical protein